MTRLNLIYGNVICILSHHNSTYLSCYFQILLSLAVLLSVALLARLPISAFYPLEN